MTRTFPHIFLILLLFGWTPNQLLGQDLVGQQMAVDLIEEARYNEAIVVLNEMITPQSQDPRLILLRATAYEGSGEYEKAASDYERVIQINPTSEDALRGLRRVRSARSQRPAPSTSASAGMASLESMGQLVALNPENLAYRIRYADALYRQSLFAQANEQFAEYLRRVQGTPDVVQRYLISLANEEDKYEVGETVARNYTRIYPTNDDLWMRLGYFLLWQGKDDDARRACNQSILLNPGNKDAQACMETLAQRPAQQAPQEYPIDRLERQIKADPQNDNLRFELIQLYMENDRYFEAFDNLVALEPEYGRSRRWRMLFQDVDRGFTRLEEDAPILPVDRLTYRLRIDPSNLAIRYRLVDELSARERYEEAYAILTDPAHAEPSDPGYTPRVLSIERTRTEQALKRLEELEAQLEAFPEDERSWREIIPVYTRLDRTDEVIAAYAALLGLRPGDWDLRRDYIDALRVFGYPEQAASQVSWLVEKDPDNVDVMRLYVLVRFAVDALDEKAEAYLQGFLSDPALRDGELLLEAAGYSIRRGNLDQAEARIERIAGWDEPRWDGRLRALNYVLDRARYIQAQNDLRDALNEARILAARRDYDAAAEAYEAYFEQAGKRLKKDVVEYAIMLSSAERYTEAVAVLRSVVEEQFDYDVAKEMGRVQSYQKDYSGAIATIDQLLQINPRDYELVFLKAQSLRALGYYTEARVLYGDALVVAEDSEAIEERIIGIDADVRFELVQSGEWGGLDYKALVVPSASGVRSQGGGVGYDRWTQGMRSEITLPINAALIVGVNSHFISGSRRLLPGAETVEGRVNQVYGSAFIDLTPQIRSEKAPYSNRISGEVGVYDYEGQRTVLYGGIRYWRQDQGRYFGSMGVRTGEGALDLWSAGGGQFNLRVTQFDAQATSLTIMPDSVLSVSGAMSVNIIRDSFGSTSADSDTNLGFNLNLKVGYRVADNTFVGMEYFQRSYRSTVDIYFSPGNYQSYDMFMEYEKELIQGSPWYIRVFGSAGLIARSSGFVGRRFEADYIRRMGRNFALTIGTTLGASTRTLGSGAGAFVDQYNTFSFSAALNWTL